MTPQTSPDQPLRNEIIVWPSVVGRETYITAQTQGNNLQGNALLFFELSLRDEMRKQRLREVKKKRDPSITNNCITLLRTQVNYMFFLMVRANTAINKQQCHIITSSSCSWSDSDSLPPQDAMQDRKKSRKSRQYLEEKIKYVANKHQQASIQTAYFFFLRAYRRQAQKFKKGLI